MVGNPEPRPSRRTRRGHANLDCDRRCARRCAAVDRRRPEPEGYSHHVDRVVERVGARTGRHTFRIAKASQTITFGPLPNKLYGDAPFDVTATSSSNLPVSFSTSGSCSVSGTTVTLNGTGTCAITATQGGDANYLAAQPQAQSFSVRHAWSNVLQPVNVDGSSIFKLGSTVPVKFKLTGGSAGVTTLTSRIFVAKVSNGIAGSELEAAATGTADSGNVFRYDPTAAQYIFNWGTKGLSEGTWQIRVDLLDGDLSHTVLVSLKK